jgi:hypothetical protein
MFVVFYLTAPFFTDIWRHWQINEIGGTIVIVKRKCSGGKTQVRAQCYQPRSNPGLRGEKPATNLLGVAQSFF